MVFGVEQDAGGAKKKIKFSDESKALAAQLVSILRPTGADVVKVLDAQVG